MSIEIKSTLKEPRFSAKCRHCKQSFGDFSWQDLIDHLSKHEVGVHFKDVTIKSRIVQEEEDDVVCVDCDLGPDECTCEDTE